VLLIAELCNPDWVSVPLEGWSHSRALADLCDMHLVTHVRNRENILKAGLEEGTHFTALDTSRIDRQAERVSRWLGVPFGSNKGWTVLTALSTVSYYEFERLVSRRFTLPDFDLVHRLTPLSPTTPSLLARRCARADVPFVIGPLNGGLPWPKGFGALLRKEKEWLTYVRGAYKLLPGYRPTRTHAAAIIAGSRAALEQLPRQYRSKTVYIPENAVDLRRFGLPASRKAPPPLRMAFVGRLVPYKGADMLLEAAAPLARAGKVRIDVIGDGPERNTLGDLTVREGIADAVAFMGWVDHATLQRLLSDVHVFGFPSIREFGGAVVAEGMAMGLVPIVVDYGGPGEIVSPATGFAVRLGSRGDIVSAFRCVLERLVDDPSVLAPMGVLARRRIETCFTWPVKAVQTREVYRWVLGARDKPDFGMPLPDAIDA
jgi:glycosyltransferase involved in cell wall biosynthesis